MSNPVDDIIESAGAGRYEPFKFDAVGATLKGTVAETPQVKNLLNRFTNAQEDNLILSVTHEDGKTYSVFAKDPSFLLGAIGAAVKSSGGKLAKGGRIGIRYTENRDTGKPQPAKVFVAEYQPPAGTDKVDSLLGTAAPDLSASASSVL